MVERVRGKGGDVGRADLRVNHDRDGHAGSVRHRDAREMVRLPKVGRIVRPVLARDAVRRSSGAQRRRSVKTSRTAPCCPADDVRAQRREGLRKPQRRLRDGARADLAGAARVLHARYRRAKNDAIDDDGAQAKTACAPVCVENPPRAIARRRLLGRRPWVVGIRDILPRKEVPELRR